MQAPTHTAKPAPSSARAAIATATSRAARFVPVCALVCGGWLGAATLAGGCGDETGSTAGQRVSLKTEVRLSENAKQPFTNSFGWQLELLAAEVSVGVLRYYEGEAVSAVLRTPEPPRAGTAPLRLVRRQLAPSTRERPQAPGWFSLKSASAHPGHYVPGSEFGEMLSPSSVDLLSGPSALSAGLGVTGTYRSGWFSFHAPPTGPAAQALAGDVVRVQAQATSGTVSFRVELRASINDVLDTYAEPTVQGCPFVTEESESGAEVTTDGTVVITLNPALWLDQLDLARVAPPSDPEQVVSLSPAEPVLAPLHKAFSRGLRQAAAYRFSFEAG